MKPPGCIRQADVTAARWRCMALHGVAWRWMALDGGGWRWMAVDGGGCRQVAASARRSPSVPTGATVGCQFRAICPPSTAPSIILPSRSVLLQCYFNATSMLPPCYWIVFLIASCWLTVDRSWNSLAIISLSHWLAIGSTLMLLQCYLNATSVLPRRWWMAMEAHCFSVNIIQSTGHSLTESVLLQHYLNATQMLLRYCQNATKMATHHSGSPINNIPIHQSLIDGIAATWMLLEYYLNATN